MPPLGQTSDEIRIVSWLKSPGDDVGEGEALLEVETDKATLEIEASSGGVLLAVVQDAGAVVAAGELIAWIGAPGEEIPVDADGPAATPRAATTAANGTEAPPGAGGRGVLATPVARGLAREHSIAIEEIHGSGPDGRIDREDVLAAVARRDAGSTC